MALCTIRQKFYTFCMDVSYLARNAGSFGVGADGSAVSCRVHYERFRGLESGAFTSSSRSALRNCESGTIVRDFH